MSDWVGADISSLFKASLAPTSIRSFSISQSFPTKKDLTMDRTKTLSPSLNVPEGSVIAEPVGAIEAETNRSIHSQNGPEKGVPVTEPDPARDTEYPGPFKLTLIMIAVCAAVFLVALDQTIIATAIPRITDQFHSIDDIGWYGSAYLLTCMSIYNK